MNMVSRLIPFKLEAFGLSHIGLVRQNNEDVWAELFDFNFFALADGMGGHQAGEVAAREAVKALCKSIKRKFSLISESSLEEVKEILRKVIVQVNLFIYKMGRVRQELKGMGTTLCCLLFHNKGVIFAHVGDSRIYLLREQKLTQLTKDHSLVRELLEQGQLDESQANDFLYKNIITKAIGTESRVDPSVASISKIAIKDIYLMCSDGLSDSLSIEEIESILNHAMSLKEAAENLILSANEKGGHDNITVVLTKVEESSETEHLSRQQ